MQTENRVPELLLRGFASDEAQQDCPVLEKFQRTIAHSPAADLGECGVVCGFRFHVSRRSRHLRAGQRAEFQSVADPLIAAEKMVHAAIAENLLFSGFELERLAAFLSGVRGLAVDFLKRPLDAFGPGCSGIFCGAQWLQIENAEADGDEEAKGEFHRATVRPAC